MPSQDKGGSSLARTPVRDERGKRRHGFGVRGDVGSVLAALDPRVEWTEAAGFPYAGTYTGPDAVLTGVVGRLATEWDGFAATPDRIVADGGIVMTTGTFSGTFNSTGRSFTARFAHVWELPDGAVVRFEQIADTSMVQKALAQMHTPAAKRGETRIASSGSYEVGRAIEAVTLPAVMPSLSSAWSGTRRMSPI